MVGPPRTSVLVATHDRADSLGAALDAIAAVERPSAPFEVVVAANGPEDGSRRVVERRAHRLPVRFLHHPVASKSEALNRAIDVGGLGEIVAFLDDDVVPDRRWLRAVEDSARRWSDRFAFGGRVVLEWPPGPLPGWATGDAWVRAFAFGEHDLGTQPCEYGGGRFPYGTNWWCRRSLFDAGRRFDAGYGPRAGRWSSGEDTQLLWRLARDGIRALHVPEACVRHRVRPEQLDAGWLGRRAWEEGRCRGTLERPPRARFLLRHPRLWRLEQVGRVLRATAAYLAARARPASDDAVLQVARASRRLGAETVRLRLPPDALARDGRCT